MSVTDEQTIRRTLDGLARFPAGAIAEARVTRLKGLTNRVYKVEAGGEPVCIRIPGAGTAEIVDRRAEAAHARAAAEIGVAPEVLCFAADGVMATRYVEAETLSPERFRTSAGAVERAALALRLLHEEAQGFTRSFDVFGTIDRYAALLSGRGAPPPEGFDALLAGAADIRQALSARRAEERPCHCDPTGGNLLDTGERVLLIDWEYSAQNDPLWDLAYLSLENEFSAAMDEHLLRVYLGRPPNVDEARRMAIHKPLCELLAALWAMIQKASGNEAVDFSSYVDERLRRARTLMLTAAR